MKLPAASHLALAMQISISAIGLGGLAAAPPARGLILMLPLDGGSREAMARLAIAADALLVAPGPLPGAMIVEGGYAQLARATAGRPILLLAAPRAGCDAR